MEMFKFLSVSILVFNNLFDVECNVDPRKSLIWGPGLSPQLVVLPARYFFIQAVDSNGEKLSKLPDNPFTVHINGTSDFASDCKAWLNILDTKDGLFIVRYKMYYTCSSIQIHVKHGNLDVGNSPYLITGPVYPDECDCPVHNFSEWQQQNECKSNYKQIDNDLQVFSNVDFPTIRENLLIKFNNPGSISICHYAIKENEVYRKCFGQHTGFKIFMDAILLSLTRKVVLPDIEFFVNLGDWPLIKKTDNEIFPVFSWCGSEDTFDIVMPTYDITQSTLENMGRVTVDMLSVQGNNDRVWEDKIEKAFWRGRDSRRERLRLIEIAREHPELLNASLTNFFFFRDEIEKYGPKEDHISFFKFFDYKYQVNVDGTVAAYRVPYLLAGGSLVFKQESKYYEHFYKNMDPWTHYVPLKRDMSDLIERILWAKQNDHKAKEIARNGVKFAQKNLLPQDIICYHAVLLKEWNKRLKNPISILDDMEHVTQSKPDPLKGCDCHRKPSRSEDKKDEL